MAGPWDKYAASGSGKPWEKYGSTPTNVSSNPLSRGLVESFNDAISNKPVQKWGDQSSPVGALLNRIQSEKELAEKGVNAVPGAFNEFGAGTINALSKLAGRGAVVPEMDLGNAVTGQGRSLDTLLGEAGVPEGAHLSDVVPGYGEKGSPWYRPEKGGALDPSVRSGAANAAQLLAGPKEMEMALGGMSNAETGLRALLDNNSTQGLLQKLSGLSPRAAAAFAEDPDAVKALQAAQKSQDYSGVRDRVLDSYNKAMSFIKQNGIQNSTRAKELLADKAAPVSIEDLRTLATSEDPGTIPGFKGVQDQVKNYLAKAEADQVAKRPFGAQNMGGGTAIEEQTHSQAPLDLKAPDKIVSGDIDSTPDQGSLLLPDPRGVQTTFTPPKAVTRIDPSFEKGASMAVPEQEFDASGQNVARKDFNSSQIQEALPLPMGDPDTFQIPGDSAYELRQLAGKMSKFHSDPITGAPTAKSHQFSNVWRNLKDNINGLTEDDVGNIVSNLADETTSGIKTQKGIKSIEKNPIAAIATKSPDKTLRLDDLATDYGETGLKNLRDQYQAASELNKPLFGDASIVKPWTLVTPASKTIARKLLTVDSGPALQNMDASAISPWALIK